MNPILADIYSTVIPSAPFIIAAYVILWAVLLVYVIGVARGLKKTEAQVALLEKQMKHDDGRSCEGDGELGSEGADSH